MSWVTLTAADVQLVLNGDRLELVERLALAPGQANVIAETLDLVTEEVRGYVAAKGALEADGIPAVLKKVALALVAEALLTRAEVPQMPQEIRDAANRARTRLENLSSAELGGGGPKPSISGNSRRFTRDSQDGI